MKKVFIDLGCHDGDSIKEFCKWLVPLHEKGQEVEIYGVDPNPKFPELWKRVDLPIKVTWINAAAWVSRGSIKFLLDETDKAFGSTLLKEKSISDPKTIMVDTFDFSEFLKQFKDDSVVVKMDIEGAEFAILERLLNEGTINIIEMLYLEWHDRKMEPKFRSKRYELIELMKKTNVEVVNW